jgi:Domain of unknown function (DUF4158)
MKQQWTTQELLDHWTLIAQEMTLIQSVSQTAYNQFGYGLLFKIFQRDGKFPQRKQDVPPVIMEHIGRQLRVPEEALDFYSWTGRTAKRHRVHIRKLLGFTIGTVSDAHAISVWLSSQALVGEDRHIDRLKEAVYTRFKNLKIEPPEPKSIDRLIRSAVRNVDEQFYSATTERLSRQTREKLDALLRPAALVDGTVGTDSIRQGLRSEAGPSSLESVFTEIEKLQRIRSLGLPADLFSQTSRKLVS